MGYLSISANLYEIENIKDIKYKIKKITDLQNEYHLNFFMVLKVIKSNNIENDLLELIKLEKEFNIKVEINNSNDFKENNYSKENSYSFGNLCYAGCNFFHIDFKGNIMRCYTNQINELYYKLGNLLEIDKIQIFEKAFPCLSAQNGTCNGCQSFREKNILTNETVEKHKLKIYR